MHAGKKLRVDCGDMCRYICESFRQRRSRGCDRVVGVAELAVVDSPILTSCESAVFKPSCYKCNETVRTE
jgi:hypothetical protein